MLFKAKVTKFVNLNGQSFQIVQNVKYTKDFEPVKSFPSLFEKIENQSLLLDDTVDLQSTVKEDLKIQTKNQTKTEAKNQTKTETKNQTKAKSRQKSQTKAKNQTKTENKGKKWE